MEDPGEGPRSLVAKIPKSSKQAGQETRWGTK